jgi:hypothetical protein
MLGQLETVRRATAAAVPTVVANKFAAYGAGTRYRTQRIETNFA